MNNPNSITRRDFVRTAAMTAGAVTASLALTQNSQRAFGADDKTASARPFIGFQADVTYLMRYGIAKFLDDVQTRANVNTVVLRSHLFEPSWAGIDRAINPAGNFATAHPQYYQNIFMKPQPLQQGDFDLPDAMQKIQAETKKRGVKLICWMEEDNAARPNIKGFDQLYEIDLYGRRTENHPGGPCLNNPYYRNLITAQIEDYIKSYEVDGLQRGSERQGPLGNALGAWHHGAKSDPGHTSCFCEYCSAKAAKLGINFEKVKEGYKALEVFVRDGRAGKRPRDGYFVEFWRLLLRYPELLAWETFWSDSMRETQHEFAAKAKSLKPDVLIGYHIWHNIAFNPIYRAEQDYKPYTEFADFLKPVVYDNPAGERMTSFVDSVTQNIFGDLSKQQMLDFEYAVMDLKEKSYDEIIGRPRAEYQAQLQEQPINGTPRGRFLGFSADYVYRETKRTVDAVAGSKTKVYPGLGIDVQMPNSTPQSVHDCVQAIFKAGGTGMVISTSHAAMKPENLSAVGTTLKELKLA